MSIHHDNPAHCVARRKIFSALWQIKFLFLFDLGLLCLQLHLSLSVSAALPCLPELRLTRFACLLLKCLIKIHCIIETPLIIVCTLIPVLLEQESLLSQLTLQGANLCFKVVFLLPQLLIQHRALLLILLQLIHSKLILLNRFIQSLLILLVLLHQHLDSLPFRATETI